jgi:hypothetical protein
MANLNYFLEKNNKTNEIVYMEYEKLDGYKLTPKTNVYDGIKVNKIIFINPSLSEKIIKKKIDVKVKRWLDYIRFCDEDPNGGDEGEIRRSLMQAEKLRVNILNTYAKYLGHDYQGLTLKKIQIIINEFRMRLFSKQFSRKQDLFYLDEDMQEKSSGRRGR